MDDFMPEDEVLVRLPFQLAGRLPDRARDMAGRLAAGAQWDLLIEDLAGAVVQFGVPVATGELDIINSGLLWLDSPVVGGRLDTALEVSDAAAEEYLRRWSFAPAPPSGAPDERAAAIVLDRLPSAKALVTAWRTGPDGDRTRAYCVVCASGPDGVWGPDRAWGRVYHAWPEPMGGRLPADLGVILEAVEEGRPRTPYHRRLTQAALPVWTRGSPHHS